MVVGKRPKQPLLVFKSPARLGCRFSGLIPIRPLRVAFLPH